jgi:hypothetical protein
VLEFGSPEDDTTLATCAQRIAAHGSYANNDHPT